MKKCILFFNLLFIVFSLNALDHSGVISTDETWYTGDNPHIITGDITISDGITLTVNPGCIIKFNSGFRITVSGVLDANGNDPDHITFTSNEASPAKGDWDYIYFSSADAGCVLDYCDISYGGSAQGNIRLYYSYNNVSITNCKIEQSLTTGLYIADNSYPIITDCLIQDNNTQGILCTAASTYQSISNCSILNNNSYAIDIFGNSVKDITGTMNITGNTYNSIYVKAANLSSGTWLDHNVPYVIAGNQTVLDSNTMTIDPGCEIKFDGNYNLTVQGTLIADGTSSEHITFTSNEASPAPGDWQYIYFNSADTGCILDYCDLSYGGSAQGDIRFYYSYDHVSITNCQIEYSATAGIYIRDYSTPTIANCSINNNDTIGIYCPYVTAKPQISDCEINNNSGYAIFTFAGNVKDITGTINISGNTNDEIFVNPEAINTATWLNHNVPYIIGGNITINDANILTINPGISLRFNGDYTMYIYGALVADGNTSEHIEFTSNQEIPAPGDWKYLYFYNSDANCSLDYCDISYGGSTVGNVYLRSTSDVSITNCQIENSGTTGLYARDLTTPVIANCNIYDNTTRGINCAYASAKPQISNCNITNNSSYAISTYAGNVKDITGTINISGNTYDEIYVNSEAINNATWLNHNVPYIIGGDITINNANTLTINPGISMRFNGNYDLYVYGTLVADGTTNEHIEFTSNQETQAPGDWGFVYFYNSDADCSLDYCDIRYGGSTNGNVYLRSTSNVSITNSLSEYSATAGIFIRDSSTPLISDCIIQNNDAQGIKTLINTADPQISDCSILNNGSYAILTQADNLKNITGTMTISGNTLNSICASGESIYTGSWLDHGIPYDFSSGLTVIDGNTLTINPGCEIRLGGNFNFAVYGYLIAEGTDVDHITFTRTPTYSGNWQYLYFYNPDGPCHLSYCDISYGGSSSGQIRFRGAGTNVNLDYCDIKYSNTSGLYIAESSHPSIQNCVITLNTANGIFISGPCYPTFGSNSTEWNDIYNNGTYDLYNGSGDIMANYVFWGDDDSAYIEDRIYHNNDSVSLGTVDFDPWQSSGNSNLPPNEHTGLITTGSPTHQLNWTLANGAVHNVTSPVTIDIGTTVTIEDGVEVRFTEGSSLQVNGTLIADATSGITFTRFDEGVEWKGILFQSGSSGTINNSTIEYATFDDGYGIYTESVSPVITNNLIQFCDYGFYGNGAIPSTLSGNDFTENSTGMYYVGISSPVISSANTINNNSSVGLHFNSCSGTPSISNQVITNNSGTFGAIYMGTCHDFDIGSGNTITGNLYPLTINIASYANNGSNIPITGNTNNAIQVYGGTTASNFYWYDFGIPYLITVNPTIDVLDLLEISPGVHVQFENGKKIDIYGTLNANGTNGNEIYFTRNDSVDTWAGLNFQKGAVGDLDFSIIEYATYSNGYAVYADSTALNLDNCLIQYNDYGFYGEEQQTALSNTTFQNNTYGYYVQNTPIPNVNFGIGNIISDNTSGGLYYKDCSSIGTIENLTIQNNEGYGALFIANSGDFTIGPNTISGNSWPLTIDAGAFPNLTSNIPILGNTNNNIRVTSGTGTNTGTWPNFADLDYIVTANPTIGAVGSLTLAEGNSLKFNTAIKLNIYGTFNAIGDEILFTRNGSVEWQGIWCLNGSTVYIDSCTVEYSTYSSGYGIYITQSSPNISNCTIRQNDFGVYTDNGTPVLSNNSIINNTTGIYFKNTPSVDISTSNSIINNSSVGIHYYNCSGTPNISNQIIQNNIGTYGAIYIQNCVTFSLGPNTITGNYFPLSFTIDSYPDDPSLSNIPTTGNLNDDIQVVTGETGVADITWKNLNDPLDYVVSGNITVSNGGTLTIQDEINVYFEYQKYIYIYGTLNCQGTGTRNIISTRNEGRVEPKSEFQSSLLSSTIIPSTRSSLRAENRSSGILFSKWQSDDSWQGVRFQNQASGDLDYLTVEYADYGASCGVSALNPISLTIDNCEFRNCYYGFYGDNVPQTGLTSFQNIEILNNTTGLYVKNTPNVSLDNTISSTLNDVGIHFNTCNSPNIDAIVDNNETYGLIFQVCDSPVFTNDIDNSGNGIWYNGSTNLGTIDNLSITNNIGDYGAFRINDCGDFLLGSGNTISGNSWALSIDCGSFPDISSTIPLSGNTNNDIQVIAGEGNNTGTWYNFSGLDYLVNGDQDLNETLTIADGNTLKFDEGRFFNINGSLYCPGTAGNGISFTRQEIDEDWYGIRCHSLDPLDEIDFDYCTIEYVTHENGFAIDASAISNVSLDHCLIQYNTVGVYGSDAEIEFLSNNQIINNYNYGIYFNHASNPTFGSNLSEWNNIYGNGIQDFRNGTADIAAEYVYWGTEQYFEIDAQVYDFCDDIASGNADFTPYTNAAHDTEFLSGIGEPQNLTITYSGGSIHITWDVVCRATSYKVYSSDDPDSGFIEDTSGNFAGESWTAPALNGKKFYYLKAIN